MSDDIFEFLDGAAPYDGVWFDEAPPPGKGHYWWRTPLRAEVETLRGKALAYDLDRAEIQRLAAERQGARLPGELVDRLRELNTVLIPGAILSPDERALIRDILAAVEREQGETP